MLQVQPKNRLHQNGSSGENSHSWNARRIDTGRRTGDGAVRPHFGEDVFSSRTMRQVLNRVTFSALENSLRKGLPPDSATITAVAAAMKRWAIERGATHYCHWFQPLTGGTAEKHEAISVFDGDGDEIVSFGPSSLLQGEPDASSFPAGGLRSTSMARGYTVWDPSSPAFIRRVGETATLCIPTAFLSWTGESLDTKTPLLRSIDALSQQAIRILKLFDRNATASRVYTTIGAEQEYFLVDESVYRDRPDLAMCGRTLFGTSPPKNQQLCDHYLGVIPERARAYMKDVEEELALLGVPVTTRHNEVAPSQFEIAPVFEPANIACDHQMVIMETLRRVATRHGLRALLHEKPFADINGSGKHINWSLCTDTCVNLLDPDDDAHMDLRFLVFLFAVISAVDKRADLLRASVASSGNDHRLGGHEAPPAIMSIFLGEMLTDLVAQLEAGATHRTLSRDALELGVSALPRVPRHAGDRNRTSPFAFTGNKFEFRAVGSSMPCAWPNTVLNTIVAESLDAMATALERELENDRCGGNLEQAVGNVLKASIREHRRVLFDGDNYSQEWHAEAVRRGLPIATNTADAFEAFDNPAVVQLFSQYNVLNAEELNARVDILLSTYATEMRIEAQTMIAMTRSMIVPVCIMSQGKIASAVSASQAVGVKAERQEKLVHEHDVLIDELMKATDRLQEITERSPDAETLADARFVARSLKPAMAELRDYADRLEAVVDANAWPLPSYRELLFAV